MLTTLDVSGQLMTKTPVATCMVYATGFAATLDKPAEAPIVRI